MCKITHNKREQGTNVYLFYCQKSQNTPLILTLNWCLRPYQTPLWTSDYTQLLPDTDVRESGANTYICGVKKDFPYTLIQFHSCYNLKNIHKNYTKTKSLLQFAMRRGPCGRLLLHSVAAGLLLLVSNVVADPVHAILWNTMRGATKLASLKPEK